MKETYAELVEKKQTPSVGDLSRLLASIAPPGKERLKKRRTVEKLFNELGIGPTNSQGHSVMDSLDSYGTY